MADVISHWNSITEAQKLTQSTLVPGVINDYVKRNNPIERLPVALALGSSVKWNRRTSVPVDDIQNVDIGQSLTWTSSQTYTQKETTLKRKAISRLLDAFIADVYGTVNNYEAEELFELKMAMIERLGNDLIYDDETYNTDEMQGLHAWAAENDTAAAADGLLDIDEGEGALSLANMRTLIDNMKYGIDFFLVPPCLGIRLDAAFMEAGSASLATASAGNMALLTRGFDQLGMPVLYFAGIPIIRSDYLVAEQVNTGRGSDARAHWSSSTVVYSIFGIKGGDVFRRQPGLTFAFGNPEMVKSFYKLEYWPKMENYDAKGMRLITYTGTLLGSKLCLGRIHDITDAAVTA